MTPAERSVIRAALHWWRQHRPVGWSKRKHLEHPMVNIPAFRLELARAVVRLLKERAK